MAHKKAGGSSRNGRDSAGQRLGVKKYSGQSVQAGNIWFDRKELVSFLVKTWVWEKTLPCLPRSMGRSIRKEGKDKKQVSITTQAA